MKMSGRDSYFSGEGWPPVISTGAQFLFIGEEGRWLVGKSGTWRLVGRLM